MATGTKSFEGLGLPRLGEYQQEQQTVADDMVTLTGGTSQTGDFFVCEDVDGTEKFYIEADGVTNLVITNTTDTMDNALSVHYTTSGTYASGYGQGMHVNLQVGGTSSGGFASQQHNAFGADVTVNGTHTCGIGGLYVYMCEGTATLTSAQVYGGYFDIGTDFGAVDYLSCITLDKHNTTKGTTVDAFINCQLQGSGTATSLINMQGSGKPTYFLTTHATISGMIENSQAAAATAAYSLQVAIGGTKYRIPILTAT